MAYPSMASMMGGKASTAPIPTQTFNGSNILGTPVPQVGDATSGNPNYASGVGQNTPTPVQVVVIAVALVGIGYLVYHFNFEK